jgi:hypothetical protein
MKWLDKVKSFFGIGEPKLSIKSLQRELIPVAKLPFGNRKIVLYFSKKEWKIRKNRLKMAKESRRKNWAT